MDTPTCGLRISPNPTSDNLTQQETTKRDTLEVGVDGAGLSCPGSSVVADEDAEIRNFRELVKSVKPERHDKGP